MSNLDLHGKPGFMIQDQALLNQEPQPHYVHSLRHAQKRNSWKAIGKWGICILGFGTVANLGAMGIIALLWSGHQSRTPAKMFPVFGVISYNLVPAISMMRYSNGGPHNIAWALIGDLVRGFRSPFLLYALAMTITVISSNLTSTILFSDLGTGWFTPGVLETELSYGFNYSFGGINTRYKGIDYWKSRLTSYPTFAEYSEPPYTGDQVLDTGLTLRAFLPYESEGERGALRSYTGAATVLDARVTCVRPTISAKASLSYGVTESSDVAKPRDLFIFLYGSIRYTTQHPMLQFKNGIFEAPFNCSIPLHSKDDSARAQFEWPSSICHIEGIDYESGMLGTLFKKTLYSEELLLLNSTGLVSEWVTEFESSTGIEWREGGDGVWADFTAPSTGNKISATLCFKYNWVDNYNVTINGSWNKTEPAIQWNTTSRNYVTEDIRRMFKATSENATLEERGIMDLLPNISEKDEETLNFAVTASAYGFSTNSDMETAYPDNNATAIMCTYCSNNGPGTIDPHRFHIVLFQDIITSTGNPAIALQTLYTTIVQMSYYDFLPEFDVSGVVLSTSSSTILMPRQWKGFAVVVLTISTHLFLVILATIYFLYGTTTSLLGDSWQALAQASKGETEVLLAQTNGLEKRRVKKLLTDSGLDKLRVGVGRSVYGNFEEVVVVRQ